MLREGAVDDTPFIADEFIAEAAPCRPYFAFIPARSGGKWKGQQAGKNNKSCIDDGAFEQFSSPGRLEATDRAVQVYPAKL